MPGRIWGDHRGTLPAVKQLLEEPGKSGKIFQKQGISFIGELRTVTLAAFDEASPPALVALGNLSVAAMIPSADEKPGRSL